MKIVNVLYINGGPMNRGGIESFMMNYFRCIDRERVQINFVVHGYEQGAYDKEIEQRGGEIYHVPIKSKHPLAYQKELVKIFSNSRYSIVHSHADAMGCWILKIAKHCGIPIRIAHSHNTDHLTTNKLKYLANEVARKNITKYATHCFACSEDAGKWLFGSQDFKIIPNAIDLERFQYNKLVGEEIREKLGISQNTVVFGHVGRFDIQKNHEFLIRVFKRMSQQNRKITLMLIGDGWNQPQIKAMVQQDKLEKCVLFMGARDDVNRLYNAMDYFILPSLFEGFPVVLLEAQGNGLKCVVSDTITREVDLTHTISFLPLDEEVWAGALSEIKATPRYDTIKTIQDAGYDIRLAAKELEDLYVELGTKKDDTK